MKLDEPANTGWLIRALGCGGCAVVTLYGLGLLLGIVFGSFRNVHNSITCQTNIHFLARGFSVYVEDSDDRLPPSSGWVDRVNPYVTAERYFHCPAVSRAGEPQYGYAMNSLVSAGVRAKVARPDMAAMLFDSTNLSRSAADALQTLPKPGRHNTKAAKGHPAKPGNFIAYLDGSARIRLDASQ